MTTLQEFLGDNLSNHLMVVFTHGDALGVPAGKTFINEKNPKISTDFQVVTFYRHTL